MKKGNTTTSSDEYVKCLQKVLNEIETLKLSTLHRILHSQHMKRDNSLSNQKSYSIHYWIHLSLCYKNGNLIIFKKRMKMEKTNLLFLQIDKQNDISSIKQLLDKNSNTKLIVIMSFCKLKNLNFNSFSKQVKILLKKHGRNLYNNSISRKLINQQKAF